MSKATHHQSSELLLEKNKQLVRNFIEDVLDRHNIAAAADKYFFLNKTQYGIINR